MAARDPGNQRPASLKLVLLLTRFTRQCRLENTHQQKRRQRLGLEHVHPPLSRLSYLRGFLIYSVSTGTNVPEQSEKA